MPIPVKRVFRHLPFLDAVLAVALNLAQDVAARRPASFRTRRRGAGYVG